MEGKLKSLLERLNSSGEPVFWQGPTGNEAIDRVERLLSIKLPPSFRAFLRLCGGGGVEGSEISGIEEGDPSLENKGTVLGDTKRCREEFGLPSHLAVIYFSEEGVCWCLDSSNPDLSEEYRVVSFSLFSERIDARLADDFLGFFSQYVESRTSSA